VHGSWIWEQGERLGSLFCKNPTRHTLKVILTCLRYSLPALGLQLDCDPALRFGCSTTTPVSQQ